MISLELELQNEVLFYELYNQKQLQVVLNTQLFKADQVFLSKTQQISANLKVYI